MHYDCLIVDDELAIAQSTSEYFNLFEVSSAYVTGYGECLCFLREKFGIRPASGHQSGRTVWFCPMQETAGKSGHPYPFYQCQNK